jgi:hypothetical protein
VWLCSITCPKESASTMRPPVFSTHTFISIMPTYTTHRHTEQGVRHRKTGAKHNSAPFCRCPNLIKLPVVCARLWATFGYGLPSLPSLLCPYLVEGACEDVDDVRVGHRLVS